MTTLLIIAAVLLGLILVVVKGFRAGPVPDGAKPGPHNNWRRPSVEAGNRPAYEASEGGIEHHGGGASGGGAE